MFAQLTAVDPKHLQDFVVIACVALGLLIPAYFGIKTLFGRTTRLEQPVVVKPDAAYVSREFCASSHGETARRIERLEEELLALRREACEERAAAAQQFLAEIGRVYERVTQTEARVEEQIRCLPHEIIALLRNAGTLK
jgi:hypothetical protein